MTRGFTAHSLRLVSTAVPRRLRQTWRDEWHGELSYGWHRLGTRPSAAARWQLTQRLVSAAAHALWLRLEEPVMEPIMQDVRMAVRLLRRHWGASLVAALTLALGIGANTAIFSLVQTVLFQPLPVNGLDRVVVIKEDLPGLNLLGADLAPAEVIDLADRDDLLSAVVGIQVSDRTLTGFGDPQRVATAATLGEFADVLTVVPHAGRFYDPERSITGATAVAVVSHGLWQQVSGGDPAFVGGTIVLNDIPHEVVGVLPPGLRYPRGVDIWVPFEVTERWRENRGSLFMTTLGRLADGTDTLRLRAGLAAEADQWNADHHEAPYLKALNAAPFTEVLAGPLRPILLVLLGAVFFVLLIAAANVASLQLVRAVGRAREIAVQSAIGAGPGRLLRQFLIESAMLAGVGGILGLALGSLTLNALGAWGPAADLHLSGTVLNTPVLAFTAGVTAVAAIVFGTVPAFRGARTAPESALRAEGRGASTGLAGSRLLRVGIVAQVALALVLLLGTGLMVRTLSRLLAADPGFAPAGVVVTRISIPTSRYDTPERRAAFFDDVLTRARAMPGVSSAALATSLPFSSGNDSSPFDIVGRPAQPDEPRRHAEANGVSADYFATMGIPIIRGRTFDAAARPGAPIQTVIDQTFAEQFFPGENPVGQQIVGYFGPDTPITIVGVAGRVDHDEIGDAPKALAYYAAAQQPWMTFRAVVVNSTETTAAVTSMLRAAVAEIDPAVPLEGVETMDGRIERSLGPRRLAMLALGGFSALSLLLAALGVYGVMRYTTGQRVREIGVRLALGARPGEVVAMVLRQGLVLAMSGVVIGTAAGLATTRLMETMLFGISPRDPLTFVVGGLVLMAVTALASLLPAMRAARVDPVSALRTD